MRCNECGFLAVRDTNSAEITEALELTRAQGVHINKDGKATPARVFCYAPSKRFPHIDQNDKGTDIAGKLNCEAMCDEEMEYIPGRSPQEHYQIRELKEQREHNRKMLEAERLWREQQAENDRLWRASEREAREREASKVESRHSKDSSDANLRFWIGIGALLAVNILVQAFVAYLRDDSSPIVQNYILQPGETLPVPPPSQ